MGVKGLWQLLDSAGSLVTLESLENKVLAVDISIWLNQALKGYRDKEGRPIDNAHLLGLFQRVSKLLFYKIKPVFVFDGGVPALKRQTLIERNLRKKRAREESSKVGKKILTNYLTSHAIGSELNEGSTKENILEKILPKEARVQENDLFYLPSIPNVELSSDGEDNWDMEQHRDAFIDRRYQNLYEIDVESSDFKNLPPEIRYEFLKDMKEVRRNRDFSIKEDMPEVAEDFSNFQMKKLLKKRKLQNEIEIVEKEMKTQSSSDAFSQLSQNNVDYGSSDFVNESGRVASDESTHIILLGSNSRTGKREKSDAILCSEPVKVIGHRHEIENRARISNSSLKRENSGTELEDGANQLNILDDAGAQILMSESDDDDRPGNTFKVVQSEKKDLGSGSDELSGKTSGNIPKDMISAVHEAPHDLPLVLTDAEGDDIGFAQNSSVHSRNEFKSSSVQSGSGFSETEPLGNSMNVELPALEEKSKETDIISSRESDSDEFVEVEENAAPEVSSAQVASTNASKHLSTSSSEITNLESDSVKDVEESKTIEDFTDIHQEQNSDRIIRYNVEELLAKKATAEAENVVLLEEKRHQERIAVSVTEKMVLECQELLRLFGVPYIVSPMEAEAQCAKLNELQLTEGTISDDSDIWLFGGQSVYKNFFNQKRHVECFKFADVESLLGLKREKMINIALLAGCDYSDGVEGVGPITAMEILAEFPGEGLQPLLDFKHWWMASKEITTVPGNRIKAKLKTLPLKNSFPNQSIFDAYMKPEVDDSNEEFSWSTPDLDCLRQFAFQTFGWSKMKIDDILLPILKKLNSSQVQKKLDSYLTFSLKKERNLLPSKRLRKTLKKINKTIQPCNFAAGSKRESKSSKILSKRSNRGPSSKPKLHSSSKDQDDIDHHLVDADLDGTSGAGSTEKIVGITEANSLLGARKRKSKTRAKVLIAKEGSFLSEESESD